MQEYSSACLRSLAHNNFCSGIISRTNDVTYFLHLNTHNSPRFLAPGLPVQPPQPCVRLEAVPYFSLTTLPRRPTVRYFSFRGFQSYIATCWLSARSQTKWVVIISSLGFGCGTALCQPYITTPTFARQNDSAFPGPPISCLTCSRLSCKSDQDGCLPGLLCWGTVAAPMKGEFLSCGLRSSSWHDRALT